jgi:hypothetical protein
MKAKLENGAIVPLDPIPSEWPDGTELDVNAIQPSETDADIDAWAAEMNQLCADSRPEDEAAMLAAIAEHRREAKEQARREMGLAP